MKQNKADNRHTLLAGDSILSSLNRLTNPDLSWELEIDSNPVLPLHGISRLPLAAYILGLFDGGAEKVTVKRVIEDSHGRNLDFWMGEEEIVFEAKDYATVW